MKRWGKRKECTFFFSSTRGTQLAYWACLGLPCARNVADAVSTKASQRLLLMQDLAEVHQQACLQFLAAEPGHIVDAVICMLGSMATISVQQPHMHQEHEGTVTSVSAFAFLALACAAFMCLSFSFPKLASSFSSACTMA